MVAENAKMNATSIVLFARNDVINPIKIHLSARPDDYRQAVELRHIQGLSRDEVARQMNRTFDEVRGLLHRAKKKLHAAMGNTSRYV